MKLQDDGIVSGWDNARKSVWFAAFFPYCGDPVVANPLFTSFSLKLFCALDTLSPGRRHPFFSGGSHGDVSLKGVAVHSLSAIVRAPRKRPRDGPRAVAGDAGAQAGWVDMSGCSSRASRAT